MTGSTLSGNSSQTAGGIFTDSGAVTINNSTVTENIATIVGGVVILDGTQDPPLTIQNSIIAGNLSSTRPIDLSFDPDGVIDIDYSLIGETLGVLLPEAQTPDANGNLVGNFLGGGIIDPFLGPLADNGGLTQTHAPLPGSPAINAGDPLVALNFSELDQRGFLRLIDGRVDMRAVETPLDTPEESLVVTIAADLENSFEGFTSLRDAINFANSLPGGATITFDASLSGAEIDLTGGELLITDTVTIDAGSLADNVVIDAGQLSRVINFGTASGSGDLALAGLTLQNGLTTASFGSGGGIRFSSSDTLTLTDSTVSGSGTTGSGSNGGGIYTNSGSVALIASTLSDNSTSGFYAAGGGLFNSSGTVTLTSSTVSGNSTSSGGSKGGGIYAKSGSVTLISSTVSGNSTVGAKANGGGLFTQAGEVTPINSTVTGNSTSGIGAGGGVISFFNSIIDPPVTIQNSIVAGNTAVDPGPDLFFDPESPLDVRFSLIGDNSDTTSAEAQTPDANGNLIGTSTNTIDPLLGSLQDNGGPTQTHALSPNSPASNAGDPAFDPNAFTPPLVNDQRGAGFDRVIVVRIDIGAFEDQNPPHQTPTDVDANCNVVDEGAAAAGVTVGLTVNAIDPGDTVTYSLVDSSRGRFQIHAVTGVVTVQDSSTFDGPEAYIITFEAEDQGGAMSSADFTINVLNAAPVIGALSLSQPTVQESFSAMVLGSFTDPALGVASETFTGTATWSDGATTPLVINSDGTFSSIRIFDDDNPTGTSSDDVTANITITDDGGSSDTAVSPTVTVLNAAPVIGQLAVNFSAVVEGSSSTVSGSFTDQALGVATETFTGSAIWSDGVPTLVQINPDGTFSTSRFFNDDNPSGTPSEDYTVTISDETGAVLRWSRRW